MLVHFTIAARQAVTDDMRELAEDVGDDRVVEQLAGGRSGSEATLVGRFSPRTTRAPKATSSRSAVDLQALHFFDPDTGLAIQP